MTRTEIMRALKNFSVTEGGAYTDIYESFKRLRRTDHDSFDGLMSHFREVGIKTPEELQEYLICEL